MCPSVQLDELDVSVTGALCRAKPFPNPAIDFFSLLGQHPLPRWGILAAWAGSPVPPVPQSGSSWLQGSQPCRVCQVWPAWMAQEPQEATDWVGTPSGRLGRNLAAPLAWA